MHLALLSSDVQIGRDDWLAGRAFERSDEALATPGEAFESPREALEKPSEALEKVVIEIGPGNCGALRSAAALAPRTLHVGIEVQASSLARALRAGPIPPNLRLIESDGGWVVRHLLAPASIDAFHVYFPDPWWKKRHHKRRLFQPELCQALARVLVPGGAVFVVTDVVVLFEEIVERMTAAGFRVEPWERTIAGSSAYEQKYRRQGRRFEKAAFRKD